MASVPKASSSVWADLLTGKSKIKLEFLAAKLFLGMASSKLKYEPSLINSLALELHNIYEKNQKSPNAQNDLTKIG